MRNHLSSLLFPLCMSAVLAGCISSNPPVRLNYFSLPVGETVELTASRPRVLTGPVELPQYLDRSQLVSRGADGRIIMREQDRWAEPLAETTISRLTYGLRNALQSEGVVPFPVTGFTNYDYRLTVKVSRFEATASDTVVLEAVWGVSGREGELLRDLRFSSYERSASGSDMFAIVAAMASMLDELAVDAAAVIREIEAAGQ